MPPSMSFAVRNSPAGPIAARRPSPMRSEPGAVRASQVGRRAAPHWTKCRAGDKNGTSDQVVSPFGDGPRESEEKFLDVASVLEEARQLGDDFVFRDNDEGDVWELEGKLTADPVDLLQGEVKHALNPDDADITSAYSPEQGFAEIDVEELSKRMGDGNISLLLDVRRPMEFSDGHVPGARNVPLDELSATVRQGELDEYKDKPIAVICEMGTRSAQATVRLSKVLLFNNVTNVKGGTKEWVARGYRIE